MEKITKEHLSKRTESTKVVINGITTDVCKRMYISALPEEICNVLQKAFPSCSDIEELDNETLEVVKEHVLICKDAGTLVRYALSDIMYLKAAGDSCLHGCTTFPMIFLAAGLGTAIGRIQRNLAGTKFL